MKGKGYKIVEGSADSWRDEAFLFASVTPAPKTVLGHIIGTQ